MQKETFKTLLEDCPIIAAARDEEGLKKCCSLDCGIVFILFGDVCSIADIVQRAKASGKTVMVHMDLISGLSSREISVDFIDRETDADGIISTKQPQIRRAKELGLYTVHRFFVIDSAACENVEKHIKTVRPDCVELMPGVMPKVIKLMKKNISVPIIAGGLISDREDIMAALDSGAISISTTREELWFL
jgi:glycerol-3-phosphate responsive antiterminator